MGGRAVCLQKNGVRTKVWSRRHNLQMMQIRELPDDELMTLAREWRLRALRGEKDARGIAHELEREQRQRVKMQSSSSGETTFYERSTSNTRETPRPAWRIW